MKNLISSMLVIFMSFSTTAWAEDAPGSASVPREAPVSIKEIMPEGTPAQVLDKNPQPTPLLAGMPSPHRGMEKQSYINNFCSSVAQKNTDPARLSCIDAQKQEACERFARAAVNIQKVMTTAIDCEADTTGGNSKADCDSTDASRLDLLKQYWDDEDSSYTVLFLPDMVFNAEANCEVPAVAKSGAK